MTTPKKQINEEIWINTVAIFSMFCCLACVFFGIYSLNESKNKQERIAVLERKVAEQKNINDQLIKENNELLEAYGTLRIQELQNQTSYIKPAVYVF